MSVSSAISADGALVTIAVNGRFDFALHPSFARAYQEFPRGEKRFVVDLQKTEYLDSSALGMLLQLREHGDGSLVRIVNGSDAVCDVLRIANFDKLFGIE